MDLSTVLQSISSVGFPIVMCLIFAWYIKEETEKFTEALNSNTLVLQKLCDAMNVEREV